MERESMEFDVVIVGGGPAGLAAAIRLKQINPEARVCVKLVARTGIGTIAAGVAKAKADPAFQAEFDDLLEHYVGRPSPLYHAERMTEHLGGAKIYMKRDELNHTGAHKINNVLGQIILARRMGKTRIIAETGAGQHGGVRQRALDVGEGEAPVEADRGRVAEHEIGHRFIAHVNGVAVRHVTGLFTI